jgi:hypothetical protein
MKTCVSFEDLLRINRPQVDYMQKIGEAITDPNSLDACEIFTKQVRIVEGLLIQTYGIAAEFSKRAADLQEIADIWSSMAMFCNVVLQTLSLLKDKFPYCGTPQLYDMALDYKLECDKRFRGVLEEVSCQRVEIPKGILPELS